MRTRVYTSGKRRASRKPWQSKTDHEYFRLGVRPIPDPPAIAIGLEAKSNRDNNNRDKACKLAEPTNIPRTSTNCGVDFL